MGFRTCKMNVKNFIYGTSIINEYVTNSSMCAIGNSSVIIFAYLNKISDEDKQTLERLGWKVLSGGFYNSAECELYSAPD